MTYAPPFASTKATSPVVVRVEDTLPVVVVQFVDEDGEVVNASAWNATLEMYDAMGDSTVIPGTWDAVELAWYFPWPDPFLLPAEYRCEIGITDGSVVLHYAAPHVLAYDPALLWADPYVVMQLSGEDCTYDEAVAAIWLATDAVRAWATIPVPSPVPAVVRRAVAILAARVLTSPGLSSGTDSPIISERIGDYSVQYVNPSSGGSLAVSGEAADMLGFLRPSQYDTYIGPNTLSTVPGQLSISITEEPITEEWI